MVFDLNGKFVRSIGVRGRGPGEYVDLGDFAILNDSIYIQDAQRDKIIVSSINGDSYKDIEVLPKVFYRELFIQDNHFNFVCNYSKFEGRYCNLVKMDMATHSKTPYITYNKNIYENDLAWGLNKYVGQYKRHCIGDIRSK